MSTTIAIIGLAWSGVGAVVALALGWLIERAEARR